MWSSVLRTPAPSCHLTLRLQCVGELLPNLSVLLASLELLSVALQYVPPGQTLCPARPAGTPT